MTIPKDIAIAISCSYGRQKKKARATKEFLRRFPRRFYKFTPETAWINTYSEIDGNYIDKE